MARIIVFDGAAGFDGFDDIHGLEFNVMGRTAVAPGNEDLAYRLLL